MTRRVARTCLVALAALVAGTGAGGCGECNRPDCGPAGVRIELGLVGGAPERAMVCVGGECQEAQPDPDDPARVFVPVADYDALPDEFRLTAEVVYPGEEPVSFTGSISKDTPRCGCPVTTARARPDGSLRG
jgi:hypothetical protein